MEHLGNIIRMARLKKHLSQEELGKKLGVSGAAVSNWEKDKYAPDGHLLQKLALLLDIVEDLFPGYVKSNNEPTLQKESRRSVVTRDEFDLLLQEVQSLRKSISMDVIHQANNHTAIAKVVGNVDVKGKK